MNNLFFYNYYPPIPTDLDDPPTIYALLNSYVNYGKDVKTPINKLAENGRELFFNFEYPLTNNISRATFEIMILNHFLMRRIGYETVTAFNIALNVKINEIMPKYNKLFDSMIGWDLFNDGEKTTRVVENENNILATSSGSSNNVSDRRYAELPQSQLSNLQDGSYVTDYNYDTDNATTSNNSSSTDKGVINEIVNKSNLNKNDLYKTFSSEINNVYTLIFKELEPLFYGLA